MKKSIFIETFNKAEVFMTLIKAFKTGLLGASLCMANISGTVTDTGTTPISGAVVQLEKGGQTSTTGADGRFMLVVSSAILPGNIKLLSGGLSAGISGNKLSVAIGERSVVEVATFDLNGNALSTVHKTLDAGRHFISLQQIGMGLHLYKVKSGNREFVLKGNAISVVSFGSTLSSQCSSSNSIAKQKKLTAYINDVISATKTGYLNYRVVVYNSDITGINIKMIANAGNLTDDDGNVYQTVSIGNQVWTVDNLRVTKYNDGSFIPLDTSTSTWSDTTPRYRFFVNTSNADNINKYGGFYNWYAVNTGKLAPAGWHVPTLAEWDTLENHLIAKGYNWDGTTTGNKIAKSLAAKTDWCPYGSIGAVGDNLTLNNNSGFSALPCGYFNSVGAFDRQCYGAGWWCATESEHIASNAWFLNLYYDVAYLGRSYNYLKSCGFPVRLLRD